MRVGITKVAKKGMGRESLLWQKCRILTRKRPQGEKHWDCKTIKQGVQQRSSADLCLATSSLFEFLLGVRLSQVVSGPQVGPGYRYLSLVAARI